MLRKDGLVCRSMKLDEDGVGTRQLLCGGEEDKRSDVEANLLVKPNS
jgi:hypothetical protein